MALIICRECGKEISDKAVACPNCGYPMKYPIPDFRDIEIHYDTNWNEWYYDTKNCRQVSYGEYAQAQAIYEEELKRNMYKYQGQVPLDILAFKRKR